MGETNLHEFSVIYDDGINRVSISGIEDERTLQAIRSRVSLLYTHVLEDLDTDGREQHKEQHG